MLYLIYNIKKIYNSHSIIIVAHTQTPRKKPHYLTIEQIQTALNYADEKTDELIIKLLSSTGLRIHEALTITKKQLRNTDENGNALIEIIGKNTKRRIVVIPNKLVKNLRRYSKKITYTYLNQKDNKDNQDP